MPIKAQYPNDKKRYDFKNRRSKMEIKWKKETFNNKAFGLHFTLGFWPLYLFKSIKRNIITSIIFLLLIGTVDAYSNSVKILSDKVISSEVREELHTNPFPSISYSKVLIKILATLALLLGGIFMFYFFLKRSRIGFLSQKGIIKVISSHYLNPRTAIFLFDIADEIIVVGLSGNQMFYLTRIENDNTKKKLEENLSTEANEDFNKEFMSSLYSSSLNIDKENSNLPNVISAIKSKVKGLKN
ncbi:MAG: flagellar biosynthetic protein FliO [Thermodesulfobacteriota bacterium]|nr:flagellar biosynthetic protein FliO [Thermodesulfobacteriota bacterium]